MEMDVRNRLVGCDSIVLPYSNTWPLEGIVNCTRNSRHSIYYGMPFLLVELKQRWNMASWDDNDMPNTPLLPCNKDRDFFGSAEDCEWTPSAQVVTERTAISLRHVKTSVGHIWATDVRKAWNSCMLI